MRTVTAIILCLVGLAGPGCTRQEPPAASGGYVRVEQYDPARDAARDIEDALREAARTNRRVLLEVGGEWCVWCHKLDAFFEEHADLAAYLQRHFVLAKINFSPENENQEVLSRYPTIPGYPHFFVLDAGGELLISQDTGELESGDHHDREKMRAFLKRAAGE